MNCVAILCFRVRMTMQPSKQLQEVSPNKESVPTYQEERPRPGPSTSTSMKRKKVQKMQSGDEVSTIPSQLLEENRKKDTKLVTTSSLP